MTLYPAQSEPTVGTDTTGGDDEYLSEADLRAMSYEDLSRLCLENNIKPNVDNKEDLLDYLLKEFGV